MIWTSWRRQRAQLIALLGLLVIGAGVIILLRSNMMDTINSSQLGRCAAQGGQDCSIADEVSSFRAAWTTTLNMGQLAILALPVLIGMFIGAPLFARELEQGTHVLAFTQSVSRTRWTLSKIVVALVPALIVLIALQALISWWLSGAGLLGPRVNGSFHFLNFGIEHVSPVAYTLFSFALGTFVGVVSRRTLVAMAAALGAFVVLRYFLSDVVNRLVPIQREEVVSSESLKADKGADLIVSKGYLDAAGRPIPKATGDALHQTCKTTAGAAANPQEAFQACLPQSGLAKKYADFIPESQAWQIHLVDASIYGTLALLLLAGTVWAVRRQS